MMRKFILLFVFAFSSWVAIGQSEHHAISQGEHEHTKHFRAAVLIGHTSVPTRHSRKHLFIPTWGFDIEYWFNHRFGLGIHSDIELQSFLVEEGENELLEREYPFITSLDLLYRPIGGLVLVLGPGYEFEKQEDFKLIRFGIEYEFEFGDNWDLSPSIFYDTRFDAFDTWSIMLGVGKRF